VEYFVYRKKIQEKIQERKEKSPDTKRTGRPEGLNITASIGKEGCRIENSTYLKMGMNCLFTVKLRSWLTIIGS